MLKTPKVLPSWMYCDPLRVADQLIHKVECDRRKEERKIILLRENKHRRIEALTRKAMAHA
jgi:hypothetical protein